LKSTMAGITGNISAVKFDAEAVFTKTSDVFVFASANATTSSTINFTEGTTVSLANTAAGPYTYNITNVPDISLNSHILTVLTNAGASNYNTCYGNIITVNGESNIYTLLWNSGENASVAMADVQVGDVVTQQIALLPLDFSLNVAISGVSFYRRG
jgi:hypothetical protein